jgi:chromate transporter
MFELFYYFFKIGLFTFGGGYAMIPLIENVCVEQKHWITHEDMMNITVIAESTPGPIAINCATFVGCRKAGVPGALAATLGVVLPSFVIIYAISMFLDNFLEITMIANAFKGIKIGVGILIVNAGLNMLKKLPKGALSRWIFACSLAVMLAVNWFSLGFSTISLMMIAGAVGVMAAVIGKDGEKA